MNKCIICGKELTKKTVFSLTMRILCIFYGNKYDWEGYSSCQGCRDLYARGIPIHEIRKLRA